MDLDDSGERLHFLDNGKGFILMNDATGWNHMYYYDMNGKLINAVTSFFRLERFSTVRCLVK